MYSDIAEHSYLGHQGQVKIKGEEPYLVEKRRKLEVEQKSFIGN